MSLRISNLMKRARGFHFVLPERFKGTVVDRAVTFWKNLYLDYESAVLDIATAVREKPKKTLAYVAGCGFIAYCAVLTPGEQSYREEFLEACQDVALLYPSSRNPSPVKEFTFIEECFNEDRIRFTSFGIVSLIWFTDYGREAGNFEAKCSYLQPNLFSYPSRVLDVGFLGKWRRLPRIMEDYDISPEENV